MQQDKTSQQARKSTLVAGPLSAEEVTRLQSIRAHFLKNTQYLDRVLDERRMRFMRYLIEQGELSDECA